jgi:hypothetical protein
MKKLVLVASMLMILGMVALAQAVTITELSSSWKIVTDWNGTWDSANADVAERLGTNWHLATFADRLDQLGIYSLADYILGGLSNNYGSFWLGGRQWPINTLGAADNWTWITGETWTSSLHWYANIGSGIEEPNDNFVPGSEQYLAMLSNGFVIDKGDAYGIAGYIAEKGTAIVPEPVTMLLLGLGLMGLAEVRRKLKK